ncbi:MAG: ABC transporter ATP-binding protein [Alphaproteobacteria bacterium]|nr:ABC transporter ATP-binding protein [Alphaproteobacteria bacterium]
MTAPAIRLSDLRKNFGATEIIRGVDLEIRQGERHAIIGPNGAGKSTLFNLVTGRLAPTEGRIEFEGQDITAWPPYRIARLGLARSFQVTNIFPRLSVFENLRCAVLWPLRQGYAFWRMVDTPADVRERTHEVLGKIGLAARAQVPAGLLSYAEQRALEIGIAIAGGARVILLDEPTAGMNRGEAERAVALIREVSAGRTLVMVEHDMSVVFDLADRITVLVYGQVIASGPPAEIRADRAVKEAYLGEAAA